MRLLLLSNSTNPGESFLEWARPLICDFLKPEDGKILFIPYAAVSLSYDSYYEKVREKFAEMGYETSSIHHFTDPNKALIDSEIIVVGGGNTFHLLYELEKHGLMEVISEKCRQGTPYLGWSAGINLVCPTIRTTNDMPVIQTVSLNALGLLSFQINPHYTDRVIEGHGGESREMRIEEFTRLNQDVAVVGLRESSALKSEHGNISLLGKHSARIFRYNKEPIEWNGIDDISLYLGDK